MTTPDINTPEKSGRLQFRIDIILTVLFLATIFVMGIMTLVSDFDGVYGAATHVSRLKGYLDASWQEASLMDKIEARVRSTDDYLAENIYMADELGYLNSSMQYAIGKRVVNTGSSQMITLNTGHLFDLQNYVSMETAAGNIQTMQQTVPAGVPFLYVYEHPTVYDYPLMMPEGYDVLDHSEEIYAEIMERLTAMDIPMLDSRQILTSSGLELSDYLYYTDQHWSTRASLIMAQAITARLQQEGLDLDPSLLDISQFETQTFPQLFMGKYGQRIGTGNIAPDDITIYWPKYDTSITRYTNYLGDISETTGSFRDSVIRWKYLEPDAGKSYNIKAYFDYGLTENHDIYTNPSAPDCTILLLKDSFSASIGSFLSLVADSVYSVDLRRSDLTLAEWIDECQPDAVVVAYSMGMLRDDAYEFQ